METFACWWGLLLTQCFWYWNIRDLWVFFYSLPSCDSLLKWWSVQLPFINITGTTISDYQHVNSACWLHWCLILQMTTNLQLATVQHKLSKLKVHVLLFCYQKWSQTSIQFCFRLLTHGNICWTLISDPSLLTSCDSVSVLCMFFTLYKM